jgi:ribosomal protein S18 acetylase RimI-like enzyme
MRRWRVSSNKEHRRRGVGTALVRAALRSAEQAGYQRVWAIIASENFPAVHLLKCCGFRFLQYALPAIEFEIELPRCGPDGTCG